MKKQADTKCIHIDKVNPKIHGNTKDAKSARRWVPTGSICDYV